MEQSERVQEELVSMVAHDLRNPIACIEGYTGLLMARDMPQAERAKLLSRILSCSRFMEQIIEDLLDTAAVERGEFTVKKSQLMLPELLQNALDTMAHTAESRKVILSLTGSATHTVEGDAARLQQVVQNLVGNAIKHVSVGTGRVDVKLHDSGDELIVEVSDNGEGIAPEHVEKIFQKFYSADTDRGRGSLGLGLFIATQIVERHGGKLWVKSDGKGKGASFFFSVPKFQPELAFEKYKQLRRSATPPPRRIAVAERMPAAVRGLWLPLALAVSLIAATLGLHRGGSPRPEPLRDALNAASGPLR
ncbi:MAG: HAMP domain-containing histidine kinase [Elusimicrobia bacterium]|nr:HAMP domain-containing histidine kinase [Elusimicrobiota bacterium]